MEDGNEHRVTPPRWRLWLVLGVYALWLLVLVWMGVFQKAA